MAYRHARIFSSTDLECSEVTDAVHAVHTEVVVSKPFFDVSKQALDVTGAAFLVLLLSPVLFLIGVAIFFNSGGPIFYRQSRVGKDGRSFLIFKFRTMVNGAHALKNQLQHLNFMTGPFFKVKNDPRLTKEGRFLRRWSLDELPQLFNVVRGEMSLVGPRPMLPEEVQDLQCSDVLQVKPGLTGLWQVQGRSTIVDFSEKLALDREYVRTRSWWVDIKILFKTIGAVLKGRGAV